MQPWSDLPEGWMMNPYYQNELSIPDRPVNPGRREFQVNITHLVNDYILPHVKSKILHILKNQKGRLEVKSGSITLCFWNPEDTVDFLDNLHRNYE